MFDNNYDASFLKHLMESWTLVNVQRITQPVKDNLIRLYNFVLINKWFAKGIVKSTLKYLWENIKFEILIKIHQD